MTKHQDNFLGYEEEFHGNDRKVSRMERKQAIKNDRSQYKKTDQDKLKKKAPVLETMTTTALRGRVLGIYPDGIEVQTDTPPHTLYRCQIKGSLKKEKTTSKNLAAVGDFVFFEPREETNGLIFKVEPRKSVLSRADNLLRRKEQLIAVNIDQVIITSSFAFPPLKPFLIDRYIIAAQKGNMTPIIIINKIDLLEEGSESEKELLIEAQKAYEDLSIPFLKVSVRTGEGIQELKELMKGKASVFSGQSGTGKSSLINTLLGCNLRTGDVVGSTLKGSHTTTTAKLLPIEGGGLCIDTPGIKSFGVWALKQTEIEQYFTEIADKALSCKFQGCSHDSEPNCAVKEAVESGEISFIRFASYLTLIETLKVKHRNR